MKRSSAAFEFDVSCSHSTSEMSMAYVSSQVMRKRHLTDDLIIKDSLRMQVELIDKSISISSSPHVQVAGDTTMDIHE